MKLAHHFILSFVLLLGTSGAWAQVNPPEEEDDDDTCESGIGTGSIFWNVSVGLARLSKPQSFIVLGQTSSQPNGSLPNFNKLYARYFSADPLQQRQVRLEVLQPQITSATFHPSCLFFRTDALFEHLTKPAANGFAAFIHQVVTDYCFTLIDLLPAPESGWRLRVWKKNAIFPAVLTKVNGYYLTAAFEALPHALTDVTYKRPTASSGDNTLLFQQVENTGISGVRTIANEIVQSLDGNGKIASLTNKLFAGAGTAGSLLSQEDLVFSQRGYKAWDYTIVREVSTASVNAAGSIGDLVSTSKSREDYDDFSTTAIGGQLGMKRLVSLTEAFELPGQMPQTSTYTYVNEPSNITIHGRIRSSLKPDGSWTYNDYIISPSNPSSATIEYSGWKDLDSAQRLNARKTETIVDAFESITIVSVAGQMVSKSKKTLNTEASDPITTSEQWDGTHWHTATTGYFRDDALFPSTGRIKWIENADGTASTYSYELVDGDLVVTERKGAGTRAAITAGYEIKTTYNLGNNPISQITKDIVSSLATEQWVTDVSYNGGFDPMGRAIKRIDNADVADYDITQYACCGLEFSRDRMGATATYSRDDLKRVFKVVTKASAASPDVTTFATVDGLTTVQSRNIGGESLFLGATTRSIDGLTRTTTGPSQKSMLVSDRPITISVTAHSTTGAVETTTFADGSTSIISSYLDGRPKSNSGTAVSDKTYDYSTHALNGGGEVTIATSSGVITSTFNDLLERNLKIVSTATGTTNYVYHSLNAAAGSRGNLISITDGDAVAAHYGYNSKGERNSISRLIPLAGGGTATQVTTTELDVVPDATLKSVSLGIALRNTQTVSSTGIAAIIVSEEFSSLNGLTKGSRKFGQETLFFQTRPDASGSAIRTTVNPDGTKTRQTYQHGLLSSTSSLDTGNLPLKTSSYTYTTLQQPLTSTDLRTGTTTYNSLSESGQVLSATAPGSRTYLYTRHDPRRTTRRLGNHHLDLRPQHWLTRPQTIC